jgi:hypothetical protein
MEMTPILGVTKPMARLAGPNILKMGETWKSQWIQGKPIPIIADETGKPQQVISRAIWLAGWPQELKDLVFAHPACFTRGVLMNGFGGKRQQCEKDGFKLLKSEMLRVIEKGQGSKPVLRNTNKKGRVTPKSSPKALKKVEQSSEPRTSPVFFPEKSLEAESRIKEALRLHARVAFSQKGAGEVRIFFENDKSLEFILERIESLRFNCADKQENTDQPFWDLLTQNTN